MEAVRNTVRLVVEAAQAAGCPIDGFTFIRFEDRVWDILGANISLGSQSSYN
jgi:hypothetical protein